MSISILPSYLVKQDILVNLQIEDVLSFFEAFDINFKYFHIEDKIKEVFDYIFRNSGTSWNYRDNLQIMVRQFIKSFPKVFNYFIKNKRFASMITKKSNTFDFAGEFITDKSFIKENLVSPKLYESIPEELKDEEITEYFLKENGYYHLDIVPEEFRSKKKFFLPLLKDYGLQFMNMIPDNEYFHDREFIFDILEKFSYLETGDDALLKDKLSHFNDDDELVRELVFDKKQYQELNYASKRLYEKFKSEIPREYFCDGKFVNEERLNEIINEENNSLLEYDCPDCMNYGHTCRVCRSFYSDMDRY